LAIARMLARRGFGLTIAARDPARLREVAEELMALGAPQVVLQAGDLADEDHPADLCDVHSAAFSTMSCLVLNAGVGSAGRMAELPPRRLDKMYAVNLRSSFVLLQLCLPLLRAGAQVDPRHGARVIALSSITGVYAEGGLGAYGATKAALNTLVDTTNVEESGSGVTATAVAPAYVETDMSAWVRDRIPTEAMIPVDDVVGLVAAVVGLSARSVVPRLVMTRAGTSGFTA
jgi:3-oxoacyl-[acyl-carrier protein] reductase